MSLKTERDQSSLSFFVDMHLDHSHGTINRTTIMVIKQSEIEKINIMNLSGDIL